MAVKVSTMRTSLHPPSSRWCHAAHGAAQKQGAGIPHEHLGGIEIVNEEAQNASGQSGGKGPHAALIPPGSQQGEEDGHRQGHRARQAVQAVGEVHRVDTAHQHEGGKHQVHCPGQRDVDVGKGDVQVGGEIAEITHQGQEGHGHGQLQQQLPPGGEAGVLMLAHLGKVVDEADAPVYQGQAQHDEGGIVSAHQVLPTEDQHRHRDAHHKHNTAHGGGTLLGHVPVGANLFDGLAGLHGPEDGNQKLTHHRSDQKGGCRRCETHHG